MDMSKKNVLIEAYRILFTSIICLHHFRQYSGVLPFGGGYMATDFFFMLSGYLLYKSIRKKNKSVFECLEKRYLRLLPPLVFSDLLLLFVSHFLCNYKFNKGVWIFVKECLMLEIFVPDSSDRFNPATWYLGIMMIAILIILFLKKIFADSKKCWIVVCVLLLTIYFIIIVLKHSGNIYVSEACIIPIIPIIRGICGMVLGIVIGMTDNGMRIRNCKVALCVVVILDIYLFIWRDGYNWTDVIWYIFISINLWFIVHSTIELPEICNRFIVVLGGASYWAYIIHYPIARILTFFKLFDGMDWKIYSLIFLTGIWVIALLFCSTYEFMKKKIVS